MPKFTRKLNLKSPEQHTGGKGSKRFDPSSVSSPKATKGKGTFPVDTAGGNNKRFGA